MIIINIILTLAVLYLIGFLIIRPYCQRRLAPRLSYTDKKGIVEDLDFGKEFMFGVSTAAWQVEKEVHESNWSLFEKVTKPNGKPGCPPHLNGCEHIERFDQDLEILKSLNVKCYRFSVSWSALNPSNDEFDHEYIKHYVRMCKKLLENNIEPLITIWHFEIPAWIEKEGGILGPNFEEYFTKYARFVINGLKDDCKWFFTINEPVVFANLAYSTGDFPPGEKNMNKFFEACCELMACHAVAYRLLHEIIPDCKVSFAKHVIPFYPMHEWSIIESVFAYINNLFNTAVMDGILTGTVSFSVFGYSMFKRTIKGLKDSIDFIGINHYYCSWASIIPSDWDSKSFLQPPFGQYLKRFQASDFGWSLAPESLSVSIKFIHDNWNKRNLPILISEHGIADNKDDRRPWFLLNSLAYLKELKDSGLNIIGYCHWSFMDNYEWAEGYSKRFGLIEIDFETQERKERPSADLFRRVASTTI